MLKDDPEEERSGIGLGYSKPSEKKSFSGTETSGSSSLNFISFTKAKTNLDGTASKHSQVDDKYKPAEKPKLADVSTLELVGEIHPRIVEVG